MQFIKQEKPYFEARIDPLDIMLPEVVLPKKNNARITAQSGAFIIFGLDHRIQVRSAKKFLARLPTNEVEQIVSYSLDFEGDQKGGLLEELSVVGVNEFSVYPELDKVAAHVRSKFWA